MFLLSIVCLSVCSSVRLSLCLSFCSSVCLFCHISLYYWLLRCCWVYESLFNFCYCQQYWQTILTMWRVIKSTINTIKCTLVFKHAITKPSLPSKWLGYESSYISCCKFRTALICLRYKVITGLHGCPLTAHCTRGLVPWWWRWIQIILCLGGCSKYLTLIIIRLFEVQVLNTLEFNYHYHCFVVQIPLVKSTVKYNNLFSFKPHHIRTMPFCHSNTLYSS